MENQQNQSLSLQPRESQQLALSESKPAQAKLDNLLLGCFAVQKLYGRDLANTESITNLFHSMLGRFPSQQVIRAFELWLERSQEFPTPADIIGIIKRKGKPPLSKEMYISISKKDGENRTPDEWQYLRDYEQGQSGEYSEFHDERKDTDTLQENIRLRQEIRKLKDDYEQLASLLRETRTAQGLEKPKIAMENKVQRTIEALKENGATQADIDEFAQSVGFAA